MGSTKMIDYLTPSLEELLDNTLLADLVWSNESFEHHFEREWELSLEEYDSRLCSLRPVFEQHLSHLKYDLKLCKAIRRFALSFVTKDQDHIQFFGNPLIGVYPVRFTEDDRLAWFDDVLDCDDIRLGRAVKSAEGIDPNFVVSSDAMNQSVIWLLHQIHQSKQISPKEQQQAKIDLIKILHYKFVSSLMAHYFPYPADREVALATYASLSKKFDIKVFGSWEALIQARAELITSPKGLHYQTFTRYDSDKAIVYMVNDIQSRIREVVKALTSEFYNVRDRNARISARSNTMELEGEVVLRDKANAFTIYRRYLQTVLQDRNSFIKTELVDVVSEAMTGVDTKHVVEGLEFLQTNYGNQKYPFIVQLVDDVLIHAFDYIQSKGYRATQIDVIIAKLRFLYTASRSVNEVVLKIRDEGDLIVKESVSSSNRDVLAAVRTAIFLYVVLRTLTRDYYKRA